MKHGGNKDQPDDTEPQQNNQTKDDQSKDLQVHLEFSTTDIAFLIFSYSMFELLEIGSNSRIHILNISFSLTLKYIYFICICIWIMNNLSKKKETVQEKY